jgi:hypothetical protein
LKGNYQMDVAVISSALANIKAATDIAKFLKESDLSLEKAELKLKLADLMDALSETRIQIADIKEEVKDKDEKIRKLQESLDLKAKVNWEPPFYWIQNADQRDGPYCQKCHDGEGKLVRLQQRSHTEWDCLVCNAYFTGPGHVPPRNSYKPHDPFSF